MIDANGGGRRAAKREAVIDNAASPEAGKSSPDVKLLCGRLNAIDLRGIPVS
jgi:hypothetical protein